MDENAVLSLKEVLDIVARDVYSRYMMGSNEYFQIKGIELISLIYDIPEKEFRRQVFVNIETKYRVVI